MITARLENWKMFNYGRQIIGDIYDDEHQRWDDGTPVVTSTVQKIERTEKGMVAVTRNSTYLLGKCK